MSTSRVLLFGASVFHPRWLISPLPSLLFSKHFPSAFPQLRCYFSSSATVIIAGRDTETLPSSSYHPWPEWVSFVDRLRTKGYFIEAPGENQAETNDSIAGHESFYKDMNVLKDPCLRFARDRYDVFKSLTVKDIQTIVEHGCPNLFRKAVNSAKRLRAHVRLDEEDVCSVCNLRGSCDRAYVILKDSEVAARTVDIVRILLFYALDPLVVSGEEKSAGSKLVVASARKLLSQLIELSEKSPDPELPKPTAKARPQKEQAVSFNDDQSLNVEMKRGDWMCPKCNFLNFSRNVQCLKCKENGPKKVGANEIEMKKGDWTCPGCSFLNFSRNIRCLKCKMEGPKRVGVDEVEMKKGDWNCTECGFMNFANNKKCLRCQEQRPKRQLNPGEWECLSCDFLNYRRNMVCLKCKSERPKGEVTTEYEEHIWRTLK